MMGVNFLLLTDEPGAGVKNWHHNMVCGAIPA